MKKEYKAYTLRIAPEIMALPYDVNGECYPFEWYHKWSSQKMYYVWKCFFSTGTMQIRISFFYWEYQWFHIRFRIWQLVAAILWDIECFKRLVISALEMYVRLQRVVYSAVKQEPCHLLDPARGHPLNGQKAVLRQLVAVLLWDKQRSGAFVDPNTIMASNQHWLNGYLLVCLQKHYKVERL